MMGLMVSAKTGEVLAMTSFPSFDPSNYQAYDSSIYNRILPIFTQFELGSTFKILTYSMALEEGLFDINDRIFCGGSCVVADRKIRCWKSGGHHYQTRVLYKKCSGEATFFIFNDLIKALKAIKYVFFRWFMISLN